MCKERVIFWNDHAARVVTMNPVGMIWPMANAAGGAAPAEAVRPLELFFDLVFVFTITQVASVLADTPTGIGLARTAVFLSLIWWMYGGYAWLTNALDLNRTRPRLLVLAGTAGFLVMSLTVPKAMGPGPWAVLFGVAYLLVVAVHLIGFIGTSGQRGIMRIGPVNVASALVVVAAGFVPPSARLWLWASAAAIEVLTPLVIGVGEFTVGVGHFVERHGLAVIIVLGESIAEVGAVTSTEDDAAAAIGGALLALLLSASMWWLYFGREQDESERRLQQLSTTRRPRIALYAFGYAYFVIIFGIAVTAVGMEKAIDDFHHRSAGISALLLPLGVCLYLLGLAWFHRTLFGSWPDARIVAAVLTAAVVVPVAWWAGGALALTGACLVLIGLVLWEGRQVGGAGQV